MAPKTQVQTQQQTGNQNPQAPGGFSGGKASQAGGKVVLSGDGWKVVERQVGGRVFYDLRLYATYDKGLAEVFREAVPKIQEFVQQRGVLVSYTVFVGGNKVKPVTILIGASGVSLRVPKPVSVVKLKGVLKILEALDKAE